MNSSDDTAVQQDNASDDVVLFDKNKDANESNDVVVIDENKDANESNDVVVIDEKKGSNNTNASCSVLAIYKKKDAMDTNASNDVIGDDDDNDMDNPNIPDRETCQKLTEQFAEITGTDEACAQFYLQGRNWELERSINAFFEATPKSGLKALHNGEEAKLVGNINKTMLEAYGMGQPTNEPPKRLSLISWNLDGLDSHNLKRRTKAVCQIIYQEKPDIVFLQELIPETFRYISDKLPEYMCIQGDNVGYFCAVLLSRFTVYYDDHVITPFTGSTMSRNLMHVKAHIGNVKLNLINTHLESGVDFADERKNQTRILFQKVMKVPDGETVIFGGDLNMRDKELAAIGGIPPGVDDMWLTLGSRKECQYTWDTQRNSNREFPGKFKPKCRFDRIYVRHSHPRAIVPKHFGLVGIQKVSNTQSYPSDHWGIHIYFETETSRNAT